MIVAPRYSLWFRWIRWIGPARFAAFGLSAADHCVLIPRLSPEQFIGAIGQCNLVLGITETITHTIEDYIATAVRVANKPNERRALSRKVADNKHRLYRDRQCIAALENFIDCVARPNLYITGTVFGRSNY